MRTTNQKIAKFRETETSRFFAQVVGSRCRHFKNREVSNVNAPIGSSAFGQGSLSDILIRAIGPLAACLSCFLKI